MMQMSTGMNGDAAGLRGEFGRSCETYRDVGASLRERPYAILPFGSYEQHGPHASMQCDSIIADELAGRVARAVGCVKLPVQSFGVSGVHRDFAGTICLSEEVVERILCEVGHSLANHGVKGLWVLNGHGGNTPALLSAAARLQGRPRVEVVDWWKVSREIWREGFEPEERHHAGAEETSLLLVLRNGTVDTSAFQDTAVPAYQPAGVKNIRDITPTGLIGRVSSAAEERGIDLVTILVDALSQRCRAFFEQATD